MKIYPSLISSDLLRLHDTISELNTICDGYHLDIMDDHFVPNLTWGPAFINAIAQATQLPLHVHLMVDSPETWLARLDLKNKDSFVFHIEAVRDISDARFLIDQIKAKDIRVGIAINPGTEVSAIHGVLSYVDDVLVMSVQPGFSGQKFIDITQKITELCEYRTQNNLSFVIGIDGGVSQDNITMLKNKHVDYVGVASALFGSNDFVKALQDFYKSL